MTNRITELANNKLLDALALIRAGKRILAIAISDHQLQEVVSLEDVVEHVDKSIIGLEQLSLEAQRG